MRLLFVLVLVLPTLIFASGGHGDVSMGNSDFFYRVFNFAIFVGLMYYLLANPIKNFFVGRKNSIESQLVEIEKRLEETKKAKDEALVKIEESKAKAKEIVETAHKEAELISKKMADMNKYELELMDKNHNERCKSETRKMGRDVVDEILNASLHSSDIELSSDKVVDIVSKKVA
ncbi:MAG: F0F1 ATP synthase subunit B [Campylobacterales bacterium]|nr:F0F1 ATP synthase subunit B [Campylobacterales bacterium]